MKLKHLLYALILITFSACSNHIDRTVDIQNASIETLNNSDFPTENFGGSSNLYLTDASTIGYDEALHHYDLSQVDSVVYQVGEQHFTLSELSPIRVEVQGKGEYVIKREVFYSTGESDTSSSKLHVYSKHPWIENDGITAGVLILILALIFWTSSMNTSFFKKFYTVLPALLLCYFIPAILNSLGIIDGENSNMYYVSSRFLLPASLVLLCLSVDLKGILNLGPKALIMFFTATVGIIVGAPLALMVVSWLEPDVLGGDAPNALWRGLSTIAGSWIGGGANQTAMKEISETTDVQFSLMILIDVFIANIWMAFLLFGAGKSKKMDQRLKADSSAITELKEKIENYQASIARNVSFNDLIFMMAIAFGCTAIGHWGADNFAPAIASWIDGVRATDPDSWVIYISSFGKPFFWLILIATILGVAFSFTKFRNLEGAGASKFGSLFLYILVASIGMHIDFEKVIMEWESLQYIFYIGALWMIFHITILLIVAKVIKAPFFFVAVGSQANIGGAASAPIVASAFSPALAPVGVLLAVLGYAIGTIGAIVCMELMHMVSM